MEKDITLGAKETEELGVRIAQEVCCEQDYENALILVLEGELGAGKTTFLKGFAKGLGIKKNIQSPTFVIMNRFAIKKGVYKNFFHLDCYRIEQEEDMECLDFKKIVKNRQNIVCIEWGSNIKKILPKKRIDILFTVINENKREIKIKKNV